MRPPDTAESLAALSRNGVALLGTRLAATAIGLLGLPLLMYSLGLEQFGAWAVLLGGTFAFGTLEMGMSTAVMRWATLALMPDSSTAGRHGLDAVMSNALLCTAGVFGLVGIAVYIAADPLAAWLQLPSTPLLDAGHCILLIYASVAVLALLRCSIAPMLASRRIVAHSGFTLLQSVVGAAATWTTAWLTRRLDLVLIANAVAVVAVQGFAALWTRRRTPWRFSVAALDRRLADAMLRFGAALQFSDLSMFVMYQFDKLVISGVVMPMEVAHYEIASRSAQALGNVSNSPFVAFAPMLTERHGRNEDLSAELLRLLRLTALGVGFFLLLPMAVSPIALFAWVGQVGYHAAGTFALLAVSVISTLMVTPLSVAAQAMGRASMEFRRATGAMLVNIPASWLLIHWYGKEGAALGTLFACLTANLLFASWLLRHLALPWARVASTLRPLLLPSVATALLVALATRLIEPWVISSRWYMAPAAALLYGAGALCLFGWLWGRRAFTAEEREWLASLLGRIRGANTSRA
jgi:O-antigen/teichoic acid export membrane protein